MRDVVVWLASGSGLVGLLSVVYTYRADRARTQVTRQAGALEGYDKLVDDLQGDNRRLRDENAELRDENAELRRENDDLRRQRGRRGSAREDVT